MEFLQGGEPVRQGAHPRLAAPMNSLPGALQIGRSVSDQQFEQLGRLLLIFCRLRVKSRDPQLRRNQFMKRESCRIGYVDQKGGSTDEGSALGLFHNVVKKAQGLSGRIDRCEVDRSGTSAFGYGEDSASVKLTPKQVRGLFQPNSTLLVDVTIKREMRRVFRFVGLED